MLLATGAVRVWDRFGEASPRWEFVLEVSLGYYIYDTFLTLYSTSLPGRGALLFHHFLAVFTHFYPICVHHQFVALSVVGYLSEVKPVCSCPSFRVRGARLHLPRRSRRLLAR